MVRIWLISHKDVSSNLIVDVKTPLVSTFVSTLKNKRLAEPWCALDTKLSYLKNLKNHIETLLSILCSQVEILVRHYFVRLKQNRLLNVCVTPSPHESGLVGPQMIMVMLVGEAKLPCPVHTSWYR